MTTITCKLPADLNAQLEAEARAKGVSKSEILREAIAKRYARRSAKPSPTVWDLVKHVAGTVPGPTDLATNPKYMEGFGG